MSAFGDYATALLSKGYSPVPILPGRKMPLPQCDYYGHWNELREKPLTPRQVHAISRCYPSLGLGVAGGFNCLVPIDFDTDDKDIQRAATRALPKFLVAKKGRKGGTAFFWNSDGMVEARKFKTPTQDGGWDFLVEVLVTGQTVLPPTIHPEHGAPYKWVTPATLFDTKIDELPELRQSHAGALEEALAPWLPKSVVRPMRECSSGVIASGDRIQFYAKAVLRNEAIRLSAFSQGRNYGLFTAALNLSKYVSQRVLTQGEVEDLLLNAARSNGYARVRHGGEKKALKTIRSGLHRAYVKDLPELLEKRDSFKRNAKCIDRTTAQSVVLASNEGM
jgi:hypothetical protein